MSDLPSYSAEHLAANFPTRTDASILSGPYTPTYIAARHISAVEAQRNELWLVKNRLVNELHDVRAYAVQLRDMLRQFIKTTPSGGFETRLDRDADALMAKFAYAIGERPDADDKAMAALLDDFGHETGTKSAPLLTAGGICEACKAQAWPDHTGGVYVIGERVWHQRCFPREGVTTTMTATELRHQSCTQSPESIRPHFGWWDHFNEEFVRTPDDVVRRRAAGNKVTPLYIDCECVHQVNRDPLAVLDEWSKKNKAPGDHPEFWRGYHYAREVLYGDSQSVAGKKS